MRITVMKRVEIEVQFVRLKVPVRYGDEDMPQDFPFRENNVWDVTIDIDSGQIRDWPEGISLDLYMKVSDEGSYWLLDPHGNVLDSICNGYVPHGVVPGDYGDYIDLKISATGKIENWTQEPYFLEFVNLNSVD